MGQVQSEAAASPGDDLPQNRNSAATSVSDSSFSSSSSSSSSSMESLIAEAAAYGDEATESLEAKANRALECPCIADLRKGPCGVQFSDAFLCFLKSTAEEKGSDCVHPFVALQSCIKANPDAFSKDVLEEEEEEKEEKEIEKVADPSQDYRIIPPVWSREPRSPKSKL